MEWHGDELWFTMRDVMKGVRFEDATAFDMEGSSISIGKAERVILVNIDGMEKRVLKDRNGYVSKR